MIDQELTQLDAQAMLIESRREALRYKRDLLKGAVASVAVTGPPAPTVAPADLGPQDSEESHFAPTGFRASIRTVLKESSRGLRPRQVYDELLKRGIPYTGKTDPVIRTSTEMWRMEKTGQVRKSRGLYYAQEAAQ